MLRLRDIYLSSQQSFLQPSSCLAYNKTLISHSHFEYRMYSRNRDNMYFLIIESDYISLDLGDTYVQGASVF